MSLNFDQFPVVPVIVLDEVDQALPVAEALLEGGIRIIEITFRTAAAAGSIKTIAEKLPEMCVGAGTVVTPDQAKAALDSGSQFGLAPGCDPVTVGIFQEAGKPFLPGVMTPTELQQAYALGCDRLKFFPAGAAGGVPMLKSLSAPFTNLGVAFCPTGGVKPGNMRDYLDLPQVFAVGGTWIATRDHVSSGDWSAIRDNAREAMQIATAD